MSKATKARELNPGDLEVKIAKQRQELLDLRIRQASGQVDNPLQIRALRRDIARNTTIRAQKISAPETTAKA
ncbi:MAG: 50S ribosomal protein L29 [Puniceicoccales bacterium]|jgi:large subunit ribosomal protein L29|nr:50S ribosomal protein L29 [Puniceicoccales bacterium]